MKQQSEQFETVFLSHCLAVWTVLTLLLVWAWNGHVDNGYWITMIGGHRLYPIPTLAWLFVMVPSAVTAIASVVINGRKKQTAPSLFEQFLAFHVGVALCFYLLCGWGVNGL